MAGMVLLFVPCHAVKEMKAISLDLILSSASTRSDGSLGLRFSTPELEPAEKTAVFELQNKLLKALLQPSDEAADSIVEVKAPLGFKTPGQRLRGVLFLEWKQKNPEMSFDEWYIREMERIIDRHKANLEPQ
jgi:hypothetical protein